MNKTIKKIVALGMAAAMIGTTVGIAAAYDLSNYPEPFVKNGQFMGKIVIGSGGTAAGIASDMLGAIDIAASLQRASTTAVATNNGQTTTATTANGYKFSESKDLILGSTLNSVTPRVDNIDLPDLMKSGTIEADSGSSYDYDVEVDFPSTSGATVSANVNDNNLDNQYTTPIVYFNLGTQDSGSDLVFYDTVVDFKDTWSAEDFANGESIELFGRAYTFDQNNKNDDTTLTLYGTDSTVLVTKGETKTITYNGKQYTVDVLGGNDAQSQAILRIGSDTRTVTKGNSKTMGGLPVYIKDVFVSNIGTQEVSVELFVGSNKLELEYAATGGQVKLNGKVLDEVTVATEASPTGSNTWQKVSKLTFTVTPKDASNQVESIVPGGDYVDPLFGSFKMHFVGASDLTAAKELTRLEQSGRRLNLVFTPMGASSPTTLTVLEGASGAGDFYKDFWHATTLADLSKDDTFIYNEYPGDTKKAVTHVLQVERVRHGTNVSDTNFEVSVKDLSFDRTYTVTKCKALDSRVDLFPQEQTTDDHIDFTANTTDCTVGGVTAVPYKPEIYTDAGAHLMFVNTTTGVNITKADMINKTGGTIFVAEDERADSDTSTGTAFNLGYLYSSSDDAYSVSVKAAGTATSAIGNDDKKDFWLSGFGTYIVADKDSSPYKYVNLYKPSKEVHYDMFLLPVDSSVTVTSTGGAGGAVAINPIAVGMAIVDTTATQLGTTPYIVVGGPCVNSVAMALMSNPTDCAQGFTEGKAKIKLFADQNALLVAGFNAADSQGAARVLSNFKDFAFAGSELEVVTTNLNSLTVNKVQ